jgi:hypothetical protein
VALVVQAIIKDILMPQYGFCDKLDGSCRIRREHGVDMCGISVEKLD